MTLLIWFLFIAIMIFINWLLIDKRISPLHPLNAAITCLFAAMFCYYDFRPLWFTIPTALLTYWFLFDTGLNIARGETLWYLGSESIIDRYTQRLPLFVVWVFKAILALGLIGCYYANF